MIHNIVLITGYRNRLLCLHIRDNQVLQAEAFPYDDILGSIYLAKMVKNVPNIRAVFAEIVPGQNVFIPYDRLLTKKDGTTPDIPVSGALIPVRIIKDAIKTKEAMGDMNVSIDGTYCVVTMDRPGTISYSSKLNKAKKEEIRQFLNNHMEAKELSVGIIVRTEASSLTDYDLLLAELLQNIQLLENILRYASVKTCYSVLYHAPAGYLRFLKELPAADCEKIVTDEPDVYHSLMKTLDTSATEKLTLYDDSYSLSKLYSVSARVENILARKIWLASGASLYIEPAETLTVIDINSGKCMMKKSKAELTAMINEEAVDEICRQLILRNISGIIIIDFMKMDRVEEQERLIEYLKKKLANDPIQTDFIDMTPLGLVELTRKKIRKSFYEQIS